jgi:hypothetical protein
MTNPKFARLVWLIWPIFLLIRMGSSLRVQDLLMVEFWLNLGLVLLLGVASALVLVGCFLGYRRFCRWFDRALEAERARIAERVARRNGEITWLASHPLHDPELDR